MKINYDLKDEIFKISHINSTSKTRQRVLSQPLPFSHSIRSNKREDCKFNENDENNPSFINSTMKYSNSLNSKEIISRKSIAIQSENSNCRRTSNLLEIGINTDFLESNSDYSNLGDETNSSKQMFELKLDNHLYF